jgi:hypothetical protein
LKIYASSILRKIIGSSQVHFVAADFRSMTELVVLTDTHGIQLYNLVDNYQNQPSENNFKGTDVDASSFGNFSFIAHPTGLYIYLRSDVHTNHDSNGKKRKKFIEF